MVSLHDCLFGSNWSLSRCEAMDNKKLKEEWMKFIQEQIKSYMTEENKETIVETVENVKTTFTLAAWMPLIYFVGIIIFLVFCFTVVACSKCFGFFDNNPKCRECRRAKKRRNRRLSSRKSSDSDFTE